MWTEGRTTIVESSEAMKVSVHSPAEVGNQQDRKACQPLEQHTTSEGGQGEDSLMSHRKSLVLIPFFSPSSTLGNLTPGGEGAESVVGSRRGDRSVDMLAERLEGGKEQLRGRLKSSTVSSELPSCYKRVL